MSKGTPLPGINRIVDLTWYEQNLDLTWHKQNIELLWYRRRISNNTTSSCCLTGVGQDVIPPGIFPGTDGTPLSVNAAILPGIEPRATPPGIPWNRTALR